MDIDAIRLNEKDNVATSLRQINAGEKILIAQGDEKRGFSVLQDIPYGHKFAIKEIKAGQEILKYGEVIGAATRDIQAGFHAHVQNIESLRGRGDRK